MLGNGEGTMHSGASKGPKSQSENVLHTHPVLVLRLATTPVLALGLSPPPKPAGKPTTKNEC